MEKGEKNQIACKIAEADLFLKWGNRKRLRCVRVRDRPASQLSSSPPYAAAAADGGRLRRKITSRFLTFPDKDSFPTLHQSTRLTRNSEAAAHRSEKRKSSSASAEKDDKHYSTRGSVVGLEDKGGNGKIVVEKDESKSGGGGVWPKLHISLSSKEKEEDFMAMKGCKLPQRPKKRAKYIQRTLLLVSPGAWLTDMCQERYEVREKKKTSKKLSCFKGSVVHLDILYGLESKRRRRFEGNGKRIRMKSWKANQNELETTAKFFFSPYTYIIHLSLSCLLHVEYFGVKKKNVS